MKNVFDELAVQEMANQLLRMTEADFSQKLNAKFAAACGIDASEYFPHCPGCKQPGLFATGNGGITHTPDCAITLARRIAQ